MEYFIFLSFWTVIFQLSCGFDGAIAAATDLSRCKRWTCPLMMISSSSPLGHTSSKPQYPVGTCAPLSPDGPLIVPGRRWLTRSRLQAISALIWPGSYFELEDEPDRAGTHERGADLELVVIWGGGGCGLQMPPDTLSDSWGGGGWRCLNIWIGEWAYCCWLSGCPRRAHWRAAFPAWPAPGAAASPSTSPSWLWGPLGPPPGTPSACAPAPAAIESVGFRSGSSLKWSANDRTTQQNGDKLSTNYRNQTGFIIV